MEIYYGYQLPTGEVEWIRGNCLLCSEWESDDYTATTVATANRNQYITGEQCIVCTSTLEEPRIRRCSF